MVRQRSTCIFRGIIAELTEKGVRLTRKTLLSLLIPRPLHELEVLEFGESGVPERTVDLIESYDLIFSLLRQDDIQSLQRVFEVERATTLIFLLARSHKHVVNEDLPNLHVVETGSDLQKSLRTTNWALKGVVLRRLCEAACRDDFQVFEQVKQDPQKLIEIASSQV